MDSGSDNSAASPAPGLRPFEEVGENRSKAPTVHDLLRQQLVNRTEGEAIDPEMVAVATIGGGAEASPRRGKSGSPSPARGASRLQPHSPGGTKGRKTGGSVRSGMSRSPANNGGRVAPDFEGNYQFTLGASSLYSQLPAARESLTTPAPNSTFSVMLGPYNNTRMKRHAALEVQQLGSLAKISKVGGAGSHETPAGLPPSQHHDRGDVQIGTIYGHHPLISRINLAKSTPPDTRVACQAVLIAESDTMNTLIEVIDTENRVALNLALEVRLHEDARHQELKAHIDTRKALTDTQAELEEVTGLNDRSQRRVQALEEKLARAFTEIQSLQNDRRALQDRDEAREAELERFKEYEKRRADERKAEMAREHEMERTRQRERDSIRQRELERDAERALERQRQADRDLERKAFSLEMQNVVREREERVLERERLEQRIRELEADKKNAKEREQQWRIEMKRVLSEQMVCQFCTLRKQTEQQLEFTKEQLQREEVERKALIDTIEKFQYVIRPVRVVPNLAVAQNTNGRGLRALLRPPPGSLPDTTNVDRNADIVAPVKIRFSNLTVDVEDTRRQRSEAAMLLEDPDVCDPYIRVISLKDPAVREALATLDTQLFSGELTPADVWARRRSHPLLKEATVLQTPTISNTNAPHWPGDTPVAHVEVPLPNSAPATQMERLERTPERSTSSTRPEKPSISAPETLDHALQNAPLLQTPERTPTGDALAPMSPRSARRVSFLDEGVSMSSGTSPSDNNLDRRSSATSATSTTSGSRNPTPMIPLGNATSSPHQDSSGSPGNEQAPPPHGLEGTLEPGTAPPPIPSESSGSASAEAHRSASPSAGPPCPDHQFLVELWNEKVMGCAALVASAQVDVRDLLPSSMPAPGHPDHATNKMLELVRIQPPASDEDDSDDQEGGSMASTWSGVGSSRRKKSKNSSVRRKRQVKLVTAEDAAKPPPIRGAKLCVAAIVPAPSENLLPIPVGVHAEVSPFVRALDSVRFRRRAVTASIDLQVTVEERVDPLGRKLQDQQPVWYDWVFPPGSQVRKEAVAIDEQSAGSPLGSRSHSIADFQTSSGSKRGSVAPKSQDVAVITVNSATARFIRIADEDPPPRYDAHAVLAARGETISSQFPMSPRGFSSGGESGFSSLDATTSGSASPKRPLSPEPSRYGVGSKNPRAANPASRLRVELAPSHGHRTMTAEDVAAVLRRSTLRCSGEALLPPKGFPASKLRLPLGLGKITTTLKVNFSAAPEVLRLPGEMPAGVTISDMSLGGGLEAPTECWDTVTLPIDVESELIEG